jgi:hypothetical protein
MIRVFGGHRLKDQFNAGEEITLAMDEKTYKLIKFLVTTFCLDAPHEIRYLDGTVARPKDALLQEAYHTYDSLVALDGEANIFAWDKYFEEVDKASVE